MLANTKLEPADTGRAPELKVPPERPPAALTTPASLKKLEPQVLEIAE
jgi:hypothetical protein